MSELATSVGRIVLDGVAEEVHVYMDESTISLLFKADGDVVDRLLTAFTQVVRRRNELGTDIAVGFRRHGDRTASFTAPTRFGLNLVAEYAVETFQEAGLL